MATVDDKVVAMSFESSKFESGVGKTISALDKLKAALKFDSAAGKGFDEINKASQRVDLSHISRGVDDIRAKLGFLSVAALTIFADIARRAVAAGTQFAKAFTIDPLKAGFAEYSVNLNAIQTILANTQAAGTNLKDVNAALAELNTYSDKTIYNFSQMARNIGTFTAAGVDLETATGSIKGIANLAALSGSNADQAATAMYQLSQAISAGSVKLQDWNSVVNAGMGGTVFQRALAQTAESVGTLDKGAVKLKGSMKNVTINGEAFRQSLSTPGKASWLTSDVLTKTLEQFTGDLSDAELAAEGFNAAQIKAIQQTAVTAQHAATEVKTISQVFDVAKETAGSGWAQTFQIVFGTFTEAKKTFTDMSNAINGFINANAKARNKVLADWKAMGGRTVLISGIKTVFENLGKILKPIKEAFREIFPAKTGRDLFNFTLRFREFADALEPSPKTIDNLKRTFKGLFALLDIGKQIIGGIFTVFRKLIGASGAGSGSFLNLTGNIGDFLVSVDKALKKGDALHKFFEKLGDVLAIPVKLFGKLFDNLSDLSNVFDRFSPGGFSGKMDKVTKATFPFQEAIEAIIQGLTGIGPAISDAIQNMNFEAILAVIRTGLFAALVVMVKQFFGRGSLINQLAGKGFAGGILTNISKSFGALTGSMKAMQTSLKAKALRDIAIAIALLTVSVVALSFVKPEKLKAAIVAMGFMFGELLGAMAILEKIANSKGFLKLPVITISLIALAVAIDLLTIAVLALGSKSWDELKKGLSAVAFLLGSIAVAVKPLAANSKGLITASIGLMNISVAINVLALAVRQLGTMDQKKLAKGLGSVVLLLGAITGASILLSKYSKGLIGASVGITAIAVALNILALAVLQLGRMDPKNLAKGLAAVAISLGTIVLAMKKMPKNITRQAASLVLVSVALLAIAQAIKTMGGMSLEQIGKGLYTLGSSLVILALALKYMAGNISGAFALGIIAAGISVLVPALIKLGKQSWREIIKSLLSLAGALAVLAGVAALIEPIIPAMLALGVALALIGGGIALAGAGIALIGVGLSAIAVSGSAAVSVLGEALVELYKTIPELAKNLVLGLLEIIDEISASAPKFVAAIVKILNMLLDAIIKVAPKLVRVFDVLILSILTVLSHNQGKIIQSGIDLILALLKGIRDNIRKVVNAGADIIVNFIKGIGDAGAKIVTAATDTIIKFVKALGKNAVRMANAGAKVIIDFLNGIADAIDKYEPEIIKAGFRIGEAIVTGMVKGLADVFHLGQLKKKVLELGHKVIGWAKGVFKAFSPSMEFVDVGHDVIKGLAKGIEDDKPVKDATKNMANDVVKTAKETLDSAFVVVDDIGKDALQGFVTGLKGSRSDIKQAFSNLNTDLMNIAKTAGDTIKTEQDKLAEYMKDPKKNAKLIKEAQKIIAQNQAILAKAVDGHKALTKTLSDEKQTLLSLTSSYDLVARKLEKANQTLANAKQLRDDAFGQFSEQYGQLPDITATGADGRAIDQLATYEEALKNQATAVKAYRTTLDQLRKLGLDDATYKKLLEEGTADQQFADQLLEGGKTAVQALNKLDKQLDTQADSLAKSASTSLYQAGVDAAQGMVDGLKSVKAELNTVMKSLALTMVTTIKNSLKIKSPSEVFAEMGQYVSEGLAKGLVDSSKTVTDAVYMVSDDAMGAMRDSLSKISETVTGGIDANPTITPILDLSQVQNGAKTLGSLFNTVPIAATTSFGQASAISRSAKVSAESEASGVTAAGTLIKFEQNNNSPKALDEVEIYRQTKNQLSQLRALTT